ncbi:acylneuraminate cytidylyltransferase family protein [uncultured Microbacterium sp.]|uniref:acylneuraminate cytidylyltransferase family protein n=1 Tax=uncultured Microbacterium sp. TaxID=191216 RepID=UPI0026235DB8|nr:acylneuraminate cytidylyltransferase family protein [uncultured Microbacterium sp.]
MSTIATICARGGSKGVPGKNFRPMLGRPLISYTIEQALSAPSIDEVFVSTDSEDIATAATQAGAKFLGFRPSELSGDSVPKVPVIEQLVESVEASGISVDRVIDIDATSPLRTVDDIESAIALLDRQTDVVITGYLADKNPYFNMVEDKGNGLYGLVKPPASAVVGRQSAPQVYSMNASIYCWWRSTLSLGLWSGRVRLHEMPRERSIDIDDELDWKLVEMIMRANADKNGERA